MQIRRTLIVLTTLCLLVLTACGGDNSAAMNTSASSNDVPSDATASTTLDASNKSLPNESAAPTLIPPLPARQLVDQACAGNLSVSSPGPLEDGLSSVSGLAASARHDDLIWAVEDSFEPSELVGLSHSGATRVSITVHAGLIANIDWEDIAVWTDPDGVSQIFIADTGDNLHIRDTLRLLIIEEPDLVDTQVSADIVHLRFPDDHRSNVEAIIVDHAGVWLFEKPNERNSSTVSTIWHGDHEAIASGNVQLEAVGSIATREEAITAADRSPTGDVIVIRTLNAMYFYAADPDLTTIEVLESPAADPCTSPPPNEIQGESAAILRDGSGVFTVSEDESGGTVDLHLTR